jgi:hypothetical protein
MGATQYEELPAVGYEFIDFEYGFEVAGKDRTPVRVILEVDNYAWAISYLQSNDTTPDFQWASKRGRPNLRSKVPTRALGGSVGYHCGYLLTDVYNLIARVGSGLMQHWEAPKDKPQPGDPNYWYGVSDWARKQATKAVAGRVRDRWKALIARHYPTHFVNAMDRLFSVTFRHPQPSQCKAIHTMMRDDPLLYSDIMQYRAAAFAFMIGFPFARVGTVDPDNPQYEYTAKMTSSNWMDVFGETDRSKRRTLMNMPHGCSIGALAGLRRVKLQRPITTRIGINWAGAFATSCPFDPSPFGILYASDSEIIRAAKEWSPDDPPRRASTSFKMAQYIADMLRGMSNRQVHQEMSRKSLVATIRRARDWHTVIYRHNAWHDLKDMNIDENEPTTRPPIPLPKQEGKEVIRFLDTARAVYDESKEMHHCVHLYVGDAISGHVYLFHTELNGEKATTAVNPRGRVLQSYGPCNQRNRAAICAAKVLGKWAMKFPDEAMVEMKQEEAAQVNGHNAQYAVLPEIP